MSQQGAGLFRGVDFAALGLGVALFEALVEGWAVALEPGFLLLGGDEEVKGAVDELAGFGEVAELGFAVDALLGGGIEGQAHGGIIAVG